MSEDRELSFNQLKQFIESNKLMWYNIYNIDLNVCEMEAVDYYMESNFYDNIEKMPHKIRKNICDIETIADNYPHEEFDFIDNGEVTCLTFYDNYEKIYYAYFYNSKHIENRFTDTIEELEKEFNSYCKGNNPEKFIYIKEDEQIKVQLYDSEKKMLLDFWNKLKDLDPDVLSGFRSHYFDWPYLYRRTVKLFGEEDAKFLVSNFGEVELQNPTTIEALKKKDFKRDGNQTIEIPEYTILDLSHLYKPRGEKFEPGLNYGDTLSQYNLDYIAEHELKLKKLDYKSKGYTIFEFFVKDPKYFFLYNIIDVAVCVRLDEKLGHIDLHNILRRLLYTSTLNTRGNSSLYNHFILYEYKKRGYDYIRSNIIKERGKFIEIEDFDSVPKPINSKNKRKTYVEPKRVSVDIYNAMIGKYPGAYVKAAPKKIISDGLIIDLDAASLYPSMINNFNISPDTYIAKIINPISIKFLDKLKEMMNDGYDEKLWVIVASNIFNLVFTAVEERDLIVKIKEDSKIEGSKEFSKQYYYYTFMHHFKKILDSNLKFEQLLKPKDNKAQILLSHYLLPMLDMMNYIHPLAEEYNEFVYRYMFGEDRLKEYDKVFIVKNIATPNKYIDIVSVEEALKYMNNYITCITGDIFNKHSDNVGLFVKFLIEMKQFRGDYQKKGLDREANAVKVAMNSAYGVMGLKTFRYSNPNLARSITTMGRFTLKSTQYIAEQYLREKYG